jgi:hypothetical protein
VRRASDIDDGYSLRFMITPTTLAATLLLTFAVTCPAQQSEVVFRENGAGLWEEAGRKSELVVVAELQRAKSDEVTLTIRPINGIPKRISGKVYDESNSSYSITITRSEKLPASGIVRVEKGGEGSLEFVIGLATIKGRTAAFQFTKRRPLKWNTLATGRGTLARNDVVEDIRAIAIITPMNAETRLTLLSDTGRVFRCTAKTPVTRADDGDAQFSISEMDGLVAAGSITVHRDRATSQVTEVEGDGTFADKPLTLKFETAD